MEAAQSSQGKIDKVTDEEILEAYKILAKYEGIFVEPASAASVAGVIKMCKKNIINDGEKVVAVLTGHGLKDPDTAIKVGIEPTVLDPKIELLESEIYE